MSPAASSPQAVASHTHRLAIAGVWAFVVKSVGLFGGLVVNMLLARLLVPDDMGTYFLAVTIAGFAAVLVRMGMQQTLVRVVAESVTMQTGHRARQAIVRVAMVIVAGSAIVAVALLFGVGEWLALAVFGIPALAGVLGAMSLLVFALGIQTVVSESYRGLHCISRASLFDTVIATAIFAIALVVVALGGLHVALSDAIGMLVAATLVSVLVGALLLIRPLRQVPGGGSAEVGAILGSSMPLLVNNLVFYLFTHAGLWVVGAFRSPDEVALYGAAVRLVVLVSMPLLVVNMVVQPFIVQQHVLGHRDVMEKVLRSAAVLAGVPALLLLLPFGLWSSTTMSLVFGAGYASGAPILAILTLGHVINAWSGSCGNVLIFTGHQKTVMGITLVTGSFALIAALSLVDSLGALGVAIGMSAGLVAQNLLAWWFAYKRVDVWTHATVDLSNLTHAWRLLRNSRSGS